MPLTGLPRAFGRFRVYEMLGEGGMGAAFRAVDPVRGREVVLKIPFAGMEARFEWEARIGADLCHPGCCLVEEYQARGGPDGLSYTVMPYLRGGTLEARMRGRLDPRRAARLVRTLARTLAYVHGQGVLHRDIKPTNVLFIAPEDDEPVLADFGLALRMDEPGQALPPAGEIEGTRPNLAPEQIGPSAGLVGPGCDIWALGLLLYRMLSGVHPFTGDDVPTVPRRASIWDIFRGMWGSTRQQEDTVHDVFTAIRSRPLPALPPDVPEALGEVCRRALARDVMGRFALAREMADALDAFLRGRPLAVAAAAPAPAEIRLEFVPHGTAAPEEVSGSLYLDVGGDLRPGVIDHHQLHHFPGSTASLLVRRLDLLDLARPPGGGPFTLVLHREPDLDALGSAYLARRHLLHGALPPGSDALCAYLDEVDRGVSGFSPERPYTLYTAFRALLEAEPADPAGWGRAVERGFRLIDHLLERRPADADAIRSLDVFDAPGLFTDAGRRLVSDDLGRYERHAKAARPLVLWLPRQDAARREAVPALLARHVQDEGDPGRCLFFKDWARADAARAGSPPGFIALCVFMRRPDGLGRAIISVTRESGASLRGLGRRLEDAECAARMEHLGRDTRDLDATGARRPPRYPERGEGSSPDPWYDGRAHDYTIIDAPAAGSVLSAAEIEAVLLAYGERQGGGRS